MHNAPGMVWGRLKALFGLGRGTRRRAGSETGDRVAEFPPVLEIEPWDLLNPLQNPGWLILDCREPHEWLQGRIPDSLHIPMNDIPYRLGDLPLDRGIAVVCAHGVRSLMVASFLNRNGYRSVSLRGGLAWWVQRGGSLEAGGSDDRADVP